MLVSLFLASFGEVIERLLDGLAISGAPGCDDLNAFRGQLDPIPPGRGALGYVLIVGQISSDEGGKWHNPIGIKLRSCDRRKLLKGR